MSTNVTQFMSELDAGVFEEKLSRVLSEVAGAVIDTNKGGKVKIELKLNRIGTSYQVAVEHKLTYERPTERGKVSEENSTETPMHIGTGGRMSLFPENQGQMFDKHGNVDEQTGEIL